MVPALFRRWQDAVYAGLLGAVAIAFLWTERLHDLTFPVPWPDEGSFLWPALAFRDHFTLYAPEVSPAREIFWMPPGFMVFEGIVFKVVTFSLARARLLSTLYLLLAFACLAVQVRRSRARFGHALLLAVFAFAPVFQLVGNTARMESLVLALSCGGFLLLDRRKTAGLGVLAVAPLVHPNGVFALAGGIVYWLVAFRGQRKPTRTDLAVLGAAALFWLLFVLHVNRHWNAFMEDMTSQIRWKQSEAALNGPLLTRLLQPFRAVTAAVLVIAAVPALRLRARVGAMACLGSSFLVGSGFTYGWLYEVYSAMGALFAAMILLELANGLGERVSSSRVPFVIAGAGAVLSGGLVWISTHPFLMASVHRATIKAAPGAVYCTTQEHDLVEGFIKRAIRKNGPIVVQFLPDADSLLFHDLRSPSVQILTQTYFSTRPDVYILHDSPWFPPFLRDIELADFAMRNRVDAPLSAWGLIAYNARGGRWMAVQHDGPGKPWY